jgi:hypothetical protein
MMIHSALRWPEHNERDLWPLASGAQSRCSSP